MKVHNVEKANFLSDIFSYLLLIIIIKNKINKIINENNLYMNELNFDHSNAFILFFYIYI